MNPKRPYSDGAWRRSYAPPRNRFAHRAEGTAT